MSLNIFVDSLDGVPESVQEFYQEKEGGGYQLQLQDYEDPVGLKSALTKEREAARKATGALKGFERLGKSPDEILAMMDDLEAARSGDDEKWENLKKQINERHTADLSAKDEQISSMRSALESHLVDSQAATAIAQHDGVPELLMPLLKNFIQVIEDGGKYSVRVVDAAGEPRVNGKGDYMTISDFVGEMRQSEVYSGAFKSRAKPGSGGDPNSGGGRGGAGPKTLAECKTPKEKTDFIRNRVNQGGGR